MGRVRGGLEGKGSGKRKEGNEWMGEVRERRGSMEGEDSEYSNFVVNLRPLLSLISYLIKAFIRIKTARFRVFIRREFFATLCRRKFHISVVGLRSSMLCRRRENTY